MWLFGTWHTVIDVRPGPDPSSLALDLDGSWATIIVGRDDLIPYQIEGDQA